MTAIHQFVAGFQHGDAISNEARVLRRIFQGWGCRSDIFCEQRQILPELRSEAHDVTACTNACRPDDVVLLHLSIGSMVNEVFAGLPCRKAILYHNITPPRYLSGLQEQTARNLELGRKQAARLVGTAAVVLADSRYNATDLESLGHTGVKVLPLVLDLDALQGPPDRRTLRTFRDDLVNVLFVGRCIPNKRIEDVLHAFYYFQKYVEPRSRLIHVGSFAGAEQYHALLMTLADQLELEHIDLVGSVSQEELLAFYATAGLFLCMSEHEGFCIPLIESMVHNVPVLAYDAAAVPETLDGAGVLFREKDFGLIAEMMGRIVREPDLRHAILRGQQERLQRFRDRDVDEELRQALQLVLD